MVTSGMSYAVYYELGGRSQAQDQEFMQDFGRMRIDHAVQQPMLYVAMATWIPRCNMYEMNDCQPDVILEVDDESLEEIPNGQHSKLDSPIEECLVDEDEPVTKTASSKPSHSKKIPSSTASTIKEKEHTKKPSESMEIEVENSDLDSTIDLTLDESDTTSDSKGDSAKKDKSKNFKQILLTPKRQKTGETEKNDSSSDSKVGSVKKEKSKTFKQTLLTPKRLKKMEDAEEDDGENSDLNSTVDTTLNENDSTTDSKEDSAKKDDKNKIDAQTLTPKQVKKREEAEKRRLEKIKEREEREKKKNEERERLRLEKLKEKQEKEEKKNKEKLEKLEQKQKELEQKQKEKEMKEEQKRKEREEKELKRKEKEEKEEQKRKEKEQERLKKQKELEEKNREKQRAEEQKQKAAAAFVNFFVAKKPDNEGKKIASQNSLFKGFEVKSDMRLPPSRRPALTDEAKDAIVNYLETADSSCSYLKDLKNRKLIRKCGKTWTYEDPLDEVIIIEDETDLGETICEEKDKVTKLKAKFLKFHENRRPAYFGTWRKKSSLVKPRKPLGQDTDVLNYEEDSDDDWEEEEQGESLDDSDGEEKEPETVNDDYEVDNDFFVPHGHLSDDEVDDEAVSKLSPESHKQKLKLLKEEFDEDMKSKTNKIKPRFIGCIWYDKEGKNVDEPIDRYLKPLSIITNTIVILKKRTGNMLTKKQGVSKLTELDPALIPDFIKMVHGNVNKRKTLVVEFLNFITKSGFEVTVSKASLGRKIKQIAEWKKCPEDGPMLSKLCWYVPEDIRKKYNVDVSLPNQWQMTTKN